MSRMLAKKVPVELDRPRHLVFSFGAARRFEQITGKSLFEDGAWQNLKTNEFPILIWACLDRMEGDVPTVEQVEDCIGISNEAVGELIAKVMEAVSTSSQGDGKRPTKGTGKSGTGAPSGVSDATTSN